MSNSTEKYHDDPIELDKVFKDIFKHPYLASSDDTDENYGFSWAKGQIILESASDNTVPCELQEIMEKFINLERHHLG